MSGTRGTFIVLEGVDGSGKSTQFELLQRKLEDAGYKVAAFKFPRYDLPSSHFVRRYLSGAYGSVEEVGPYTSSLFYALDRFEAASEIRAALDEGRVVLCDRFTGSNMANQGTKIPSAEERRGFFIWLDNLEFEMLRIPRPDISFVLRMPVATAQQLLAEKAKHSEPTVQRDIHEDDPIHLERTAAVYDDMTQLFPKDFQRIDCVRGENLLETEKIQAMLWEKVKPLLPPVEKAAKEDKAAEEKTPEPKPKAPAPQAHIAENSDPAPQTDTDPSPAPGAASASSKNAQQPDDTEAKAAPEPKPTATAVADPEPDPKPVPDPPKRIAAATTDQARHSISELAAPEQPQALPKSDTELTIDNASGLLVQKIERLTKAVRISQPNVPAVHIPDSLEPEARQEYRKGMAQLLELQVKLISALSDHTGDIAEATHFAKLATPVALTSAVTITATGEDLEHVIAGLLNDDLPEAQMAGAALMAQTVTKRPGALENANKPVAANTTVAIKALANELLSEPYSSEQSAAQLTGVWPRNELDLVADILYEHSNLSLGAIQNQIIYWPMDRKLAVLEAYTENKHATAALEKVHYSWDIICTYDTFRELQRNTAEATAAQLLTPRYGYDVPQEIEDAGLTELFEQCFDLSLSLYSALQKAGHHVEAQYATLRGHSLRWKLTVNAVHMARMLALAPHASVAARTLLTKMHERLGEVHPILAETMLQAKRQ